MKWWPGECKPGDMIRVHVGSIDHYGIFISEGEVIQFGLAPGHADRLPDSEIEVLATDIDTFSCGQIVEVAVLDRKEKQSSFPPEQIIERARNGIGQKGYNLIHNNCEHFAHECVFGTKRSTQEERTRQMILEKLKGGK